MANITPDKIITSDEDLQEWKNAQKAAGEDPVVVEIIALIANGTLSTAEAFAALHAIKKRQSQHQQERIYLDI
ncbi:hypothetical protein [Fischerella sp. PCC 9605]|uniref:hypothetical protein n=1 Tax=Fischerella sp. PCC 9605 TaxID=1173024 RepID=UPI0004794A7C|nr:hypothetical protein [Fischerella sp. PCC 9605]